MTPTMQIPDAILLLKTIRDQTTDRILYKYISSAIVRLEMLERGGTRKTIMSRD